MEYLRRNWINFETPQNAITIKKERMSSNIEFVNDTLNGGFLSGFVEASVEKPVHGLNGNETTMKNVERVSENKEKEIALKEWDRMRMRERLDTLMLL